MRGAAFRWFLVVKFSDYRAPHSPPRRGGEYPPLSKNFQKLPPCIIWLTENFPKITALHYRNITIKYIRIYIKIMTSDHPLPTLSKNSRHKIFDKTNPQTYIYRAINSRCSRKESTSIAFSFLYA